MKFLILFLVLIVGSDVCAQASDSLRIKDSNPIFYIETSAGYSGGKSDGFTAIHQLNYQHKNDLFTLRYLALADYKWGGVYSGYVLFPFPRRVETIDEISLLYGKRYIFDNRSVSFSVGGGYVKQRKLDVIDGESYEWNEQSGFGMPFEINIKWFKRRKKPFMVYYVIPVGPPTSFGGSIGLKLAGNVGKTNYVGLGMTYSYGWHKNY